MVMHDENIARRRCESKRFWKTKRKIDGKDSGGATYTTIKENGEELDDPEEVIEYIACYFEELLQAREEFSIIYFTFNIIY